MKKKIVTLLVVVALVAALTVGLVACDKNGKDGDKDKLLFGKELLTLTSQLDVLTQLNNGSADIGVMDSIMANHYMSTGSFASTLQIIPGFDLAEEEYGIAAKKGNAALISKINEALIALSADGTVTSIANTFGLASELLITGDTANPNEDATDNSWNALLGKKVVIGYTLFAPIAYYNESNVLTGFDIELANAVFAYLNTAYNTNITVEFSLIVWAEKETKLQNGSIDLVWNGMTISPTRLNEMQISLPYLANKQSCIIKKTDANKYNNVYNFMKNTQNAIVAVENGSAGHDAMTMEL